MTTTKALCFYEAYVQGRIPFYAVPLDIARRYSLRSVLDVGCCTGRIAIPLGESGFNVTGLNNMEPMIAIVCKQSSQVDWIHADNHQLALDKHSSI